MKVKLNKKILGLIVLIFCLSFFKMSLVKSANNQPQNLWDTIRQPTPPGTARDAFPPPQQQKPSTPSQPKPSQPSQQTPTVGGGKATGNSAAGTGTGGGTGGGGQPLPQTQVEIPNPVNYSTFQELLMAVLEFLQYVGAVIAVFSLIAAAFKFMSAEGDPEKVKQGFKMIFWTIIGLFVIISARAFIEFLRSRIGTRQ